jgi:hypothetical protein
LGDHARRFITSTIPGTSITYTGSTGDVKTTYYPPTHWEPYSTTLDYEDMIKQIKEEEETKVKVNIDHFKGKYVCCVRETSDLSLERILTTLSVVKGRLMLEIAPIHIKEFQCSMTPAVRKNIIQASKRVKMYGKKMPIIARFDDYGNRLPDVIEINDSPGVNIKILDPADYGELYLEMTAIEFPSIEYQSRYDDYITGSWEKDVPF